MNKAISPLIASVLLIAFTMAVAAILTSWVTGFTKAETGFVGGKGETQIKCTYANLDAKKSDVSYNFTTGSLNISVFNSGSEDLYNFSFFILTDEDLYTFEPINQKTISDPLSKGQAILFKTQNTSSGKPDPSETFNKLRITAICQKDFKIPHEIDMT